MTENNTPNNEAAATNPDEVRATLAPNLVAIFASKEDALIFAATTSATTNKPQIFRQTYKAITGEEARHKEFKKYNDKQRFAEIIRDTKTEDGRTLQQALEEKKK